MWEGQRGRFAALREAWQGFGQLASLLVVAGFEGPAIGLVQRPWRIGVVSVDHYENFPVASWLCPPALRAPIVAIYRFARSADDIADEGDAPAAERLADLAAFRADLLAVAAGHAPSPRWPEVFVPLARAIAAHRLPISLLADLLDAFELDAAQHRYAD